VILFCLTKNVWRKLSFQSWLQFLWRVDIAFSYNYYVSILDTQIFSKFSRRNCMDIPDDIETGDVWQLHFI
jgi:hypothetical protein